ncbi:MAG: hypothetical protein ACP6IS_06585 [Candidatus Asgardarchaeia archaeon]
MLLKIVGKDLDIDDELTELLESFGFKLKFFNKTEFEMALFFDITDVEHEINLLEIFQNGTQKKYSFSPMARKIKKILTTLPEIRASFVSNETIMGFPTVTYYDDETIRLQVILLEGNLYTLGDEIYISVTLQNKTEKVLTIFSEYASLFKVDIESLDREPLFSWEPIKLPSSNKITLAPSEKFNDVISIDSSKLEKSGEYLLSVSTVPLNMRSSISMYQTEPISIWIDELV